MRSQPEVQQVAEAGRNKLKARFPRGFVVDRDLKTICFKLEAANEVK